MSEQQYRLEENNQTNELILWEDAKILNVFKSSYDNRKHLNIIVDKLNELSEENERLKYTNNRIDEELKTHNLQYFLEWLVIKGYVTDEPMKDINNVIDCVNKFKEYLTEQDKFKEWLGVLEDE